MPRNPIAGQTLTINHPLTDSTSLNESLTLQTFPLVDPSSTQVLLKLLAAPINPLDIHVLAGRYPIKPRHTLNASPIPGFDGVARVLKVGSSVTELKEGNLVIPKSYGLGTWRTHALVEASDVVKVKSGTNVLFASILKTVVLPAYFLVEDMKALEKGDWVVQNAGSSAIAQTVAQFARLKGARTVSIIRDRPDEAAGREAKVALTAFMDVVLEEKEFIPAEVADGRKIVLALDSVWGSSARQIASAMSNGAVFVNYGQFGGGGPDSAIQLTHRDIFWKAGVFRSFRTTAQAAQRSEKELADLLAWFVDLFEARQLRLPRHREIKWNVEDSENLIEAVADAVKMERNSTKSILIFE
ncbi:GroES-like protein [Patellaria atrata CBS 101060]|uniref:enoyl-[acyl-carrier-protein] reductase n=1 Tax=Patellaria atrata CBS 101060 TaxID=1346257 RepID=A0A9P4VPC5_9PEZI|nr:GroES-like protein [Patellaria atrata CBS 101060]